MENSWVKRICLKCNKEFKTRKCWLRGESAGKFCSRSCASLSKIHKNYRILIKCRECGTERSVRRYRVGTVKYCSKRCLAIARGKKMRGENHPNWRGGISGRTEADKQWVRKVIERDGMCKKCGKKKYLTAHHLKHWAKFPEDRLKIEKGITLCGDCHALEHPELSPFFIKHMKKRKIKNCVQCGHVFLGRKESSRFCGVKCRGMARRRRVKYICGGCGKNFERQLSNSGVKYCSKVCFNKFSLYGQKK